jgi:hypothetical protein
MNSPVQQPYCGYAQRRYGSGTVLCRPLASCVLLLLVYLTVPFVAGVRVGPTAYAVAAAALMVFCFALVAQVATAFDISGLLSPADAATEQQHFNRHLLAAAAVSEPQALQPAVSNIRDAGDDRDARDGQNAQNVRNARDARDAGDYHTRGQGDAVCASDAWSNPGHHQERSTAQEGGRALCERALQKEGSSSRRAPLGVVWSPKCDLI